MRLYLIRHAIAYQRDHRRWPGDQDRPLSPAGIKRWQRAARGLRPVTKAPALVLCSPLLRAWQTAALLHEIAGWPPAVACAALAPDGGPAEVVAVLRRHAATSPVALVGHEPLLSELASYLLTGDVAGVTLALKKGSVVCLELEAAAEQPGAAAGQAPGSPAARATLRWLVSPAQLRAIGR
jgi:phosphohistidine phosphatase